MTAPNKATFTTRELELISIAWDNLQSDKIDMAKFQDEAGFTTIGSARACWLPVKKRLSAHAQASAKNKDNKEGNNDSGPAVRKASAKKVTAAGKKRKATKTAPSAHASDDDEEDVEMPPTKKAANTKAEDEAAVIKAEQDETDNHLELADTYDWVN